MIYLLHWWCGQDKCQQPCSSLTDVSAVLRVSASVILAGLIIESSINRVSSISSGLIPTQVLGLSLRFFVNRVSAQTVDRTCVWSGDFVFTAEDFESWMELMPLFWAKLIDVAYKGHGPCLLVSF